MAQEIERKFLVKKEAQFSSKLKSYCVVQGYLNSDIERSVRVRLMDDKGFLTIKGKGNASGMTRYEWEKEISAQEAKSLLKICEPGKIEKTRVEVSVGRHIYEVDFFHGDNEGLVLAELELGSEDENFERPKWLGKEVTGDQRYYNIALMKNPYKKW